MMYNQSNQDNFQHNILPELENVLAKNPLLSFIFTLLALICLSSLLSFLINFVFHPYRIKMQAFSLAVVFLSIFIAVVINLVIKFNARKRLRARIEAILRA